MKKPTKKPTKPKKNPVSQTNFKQALEKKVPFVPMSTRSANAALKAAASLPEGALVMFTAAWCGPCRVMKPIVQKLAGEGRAVILIDIDVLDKVAKTWSVSSIPSFWHVRPGVFFQDAPNVVGACSEQTLRKAFGW